MKKKKTMLIEVRKDIIEKAINNNSSSTNDAASFLKELSLAAKRGKHIVYVPDLNNNIVKDNLIKVIGRNEVVLLTRSQKNASKFHAICKKLNTKAVCSYNHVETEEGGMKIIHIDPSKMPEFEINVETNVLGENLSDTKVFDILSKYFAITNDLKYSYNCFHPLMGGGGTTCQVYEQECEKKQHFCLTITDSDLKLPYPEEEVFDKLEEESTAKKVLNVHRNKKTDIVEFYMMHYVSEIENLIPIKIYQKLKVPSPKQKIVLNHDYSFFDMKKGLNNRYLWKKEIYDYWKKVYHEDKNVDFSHVDELKEKYPNFDNLPEERKNDAPFLPGWGANVLNDILKKEDLVKEMKYNIKQQDLGESQHKEWIKIGELIFNWTCALKPQYA